MPSRPPKKPRTNTNSGQHDRHSKSPDRNKPAAAGERHRGDAGNVSTRILGHVAATGRRMQAKRDAKPKS